MSTTLDDAIAHELQHPSGTMDDPLTAALFAQLTHEPLQPRPAEACSELLADMDADVRAATSLPEWFPWAAAVVLTAVCAASYVWPMGWAAA